MTYTVKLGPALVDVTRWVERDTFKPEDSDLGQQIGTVLVVLEDDPLLGPVPVTIREGLELQIIDHDRVTVKFGGWVRNIKRERLPTSRVRYHLPCQDYNARLIETATGSLTFTGTDNDRNMVIAILRDALKQQQSSPNGALVDDPIITVNEAAGWPLVRATAILSGMDFSYMAPGRALENLKKYVPNVYLRIRPDKLVQYGLLRDPAPYAIAVAPAHDTKGPRTYSREVLADAPAGYWRLGEASGTVARDSSGNGRDGTYSGGVTLGQAGAVSDGNTAALFDGVNGLVTVPHSAALAVVSTFSVGCWYRLTALSAGGGHLISKGPDEGATTTAWFLRIDPSAENSTPSLFVSDGTSVEPRVKGTTGKIGELRFVVATYDGANLRLYENGALVSTQARTLAAPPAVTTALLIGGGGVPFPGLIDEPFFYASVLSAARIAAHYQAGVAYFMEALALEEETILTGHFNKLRRGGAGASTATAYDEAAIAKYGLMESPYKNDTTVPAADLTRRAYAELRSYRPKVVRRTSTTEPGLQAGQLVDLIDPAQGAGTRPAPYLGSLASQIYGRSPHGRLSGERGRFLIQKVTQVPIGADDYRYDIELGDNVPDFPTAIARIAPVS